MLEARVNNNILRIVYKLVDTGQFANESDVVNAALREYIERHTNHTLGQEPPTREQVAKTVLDLKSEIIKCGVASISLFGSVARGDADADSDIDILIDTAPYDGRDIQPTSDVRTLLEDRFDRAVDVVRRDALEKRKEFLENVESEVVRIF